MKWIELSIRTDAEGAEAAAAVLNEFVAGGAVIEQTLIPDDSQSAIDPIIDPARAFIVRAFFSSDDEDGVQRAETALWHLAQLRSMSDPATREVAEEDWAEAWKKHYTILHVGRALVVKPSWLDYVPQPGDVVIELDPGMAFGTGLHPTTRQCMIALEERVQPGIRMLDVGTGSGILSITAAKLGAREILAFDTDPIAVETAARNAAINHAENIIHVERGSVDAEREGVRDTFDLVCINILAEVVCELAPAVSAALLPGGSVIASGILDYKAEDVVEAFQAVGIQVVDNKPDEDWMTLVGTKRQE